MTSRPPAPSVPAARAHAGPEPGPPLPVFRVGSADGHLPGEAIADCPCWFACGASSVCLLVAGAPCPSARAPWEGEPRKLGGDARRVAGCGEPPAGAPDEGLSAQDKGLPVQDEGLPASDEGLPVSDKGFPAPDEGLSTLNKGLPVSDEGLPASDEGLSVQDEGLPAPDEGLPVLDEELLSLVLHLGFTIKNFLLGPTTPPAGT